MDTPKRWAEYLTWIEAENTKAYASIDARHRETVRNNSLLKRTLTSFRVGGSIWDDVAVEIDKHNVTKTPSLLGYFTWDSTHGKK
jgi:hypothetical protein